MTQEQFNKFKNILQRLTRTYEVSTHEYNFLDSVLHEIRIELVEKTPHISKKEWDNKSNYGNGSGGADGW